MIFLNSFLFNGFFVFLQRLLAPGPSGDLLLQEDGFALLQEDGSYLLLE